MGREKAIILPDVRDVVSRFTYDPETGAIYHKGSGASACNDRWSRYMQVLINRRYYRAAIVAWMLHRGPVPPGMVPVLIDYSKTGTASLKADNLQLIDEKDFDRHIAVIPQNANGGSRRSSKPKGFGKKTFVLGDPSWERSPNGY